MKNDFPDKLDKLLKETCHNYEDKLDGLNSIDIPDIEASLNKFRIRVNNKSHVGPQKNRKQFGYQSKKINKLSYIAASATLILVASSILGILYDTPKVKAFRFNITKFFIEIKEDFINITSSTISSSDESSAIQAENKPIIDSGENCDIITKRLTLDELKHNMKFPVAIPEYIPAGFSFSESNITIYKDSTNAVNQIYRNPNSKDSLVISQMTNIREIDLKTITPKQNIVEQYKVMGVDCIIISTTNDSHQAIWLANDSKYNVVINNTLINEFKKVLDSIKNP